MPNLKLLDLTTFALEINSLFNFIAISNMKNLQILVLFLIGSALVITGVVFKISNERKDWTSFFLIIGMTFEAFALVLLILKLIKRKKTDTFLEN